MNFLELLTPEARSELEFFGRARTYPARATLVYEGDEPREVIVVVRGDLKITTSVEGREVVLDLVGPGGVLGELSAIDGRPSSASVVALTEVVAVVMPATRFSDHLRTHPDVAMAMLGAVTTRLRDTSRRQVEYGALDAPGRVCRRLLELIDRYGVDSGDGVEVRGPLTQGDVAAWAGLSREAVVRALVGMRELGWVSTGPRSFMVHDIDAVRERARVG